MFAALLTMLLSTTLIAAGPIYSSGVSVAGLRQLLSEASVETGNVRVAAGVPPAEVDVAAIGRLRPHSRPCQTL